METRNIHEELASMSDSDFNALVLILSELKGIPPAFIDALKIRHAKANDYNNGTVKLQDYFPFGYKSYVQEIHKKSLRLVSLASPGANIKCEPVRDTLLDLINYACFTIEGNDL